MKKYRVILARTEYYAKEFILEAKDEEDAVDKAWDQSGNWQKVDAEEFTNGVEEIKNAKN
jgi:hypothetical protein